MTIAAAISVNYKLKQLHVFKDKDTRISTKAV